MKVSVSIITYNQEAFIARAVESVLSQKVDFDYEIVIGDDCSTDETGYILSEIQRRHPNRIRLLLHDWNLGAVANFDKTLQICRGEYVACLEGDDYWLQPDKLQKQVEFMDRHPKCPLCFHRARMIGEDGSHKARTWGPPVSKTFFPLEDLLKTSFIPGSSILYRRELFSRAPASLFANQSGDRIMYCMLAALGDIGFINEVMSAYRIHPGGVWSAMSVEERFEIVIGNNKGLRGKIPRRYNHFLNRNIAHGHRQLAEHYRRKGAAHRAVWNLLNAWWARPDLLPIAELFRTLAAAVWSDSRLRRLRGRAAEDQPNEDRVGYYPKYDWSTE